MDDVEEDDAYQRWDGWHSLQLPEVTARELFDKHWGPAPGAALATPPGFDRRMGRRGESEARVERLEARIEQLEKYVDELLTMTIVKCQGAILKEMAAKVAEGLPTTS